jgi:chromosome segregation ATPase
MEAHKNLKLQFDAMKLQLDKLGQRNHELENHSSMTGAYVVDQENASLRDQLAELTKRYGELESSHRVLTLARDENSTKISQLRDRVFELEAEGKRLRKLSGEHWDALERLSSMSMEMMRFAERRLGRYGDVAGPSGGHG